MNQFFYETRATEKLKELRREGQASQAIRRSHATQDNILHGVLHGILRFARVIARIASIQQKHTKKHAPST